jgi:tetratricopeptide (TPR) repeat protein
LRDSLGRVDEAEQFLRDGLRANPGHPELLFELGRIFREARKDHDRARNVWELALRKWRQLDAATREDQRFLHAQMLGQLADLEHNAGRYAEAAVYWRELLPLSPYKDSIQKWLTEAESRAATPPRQ